MGLSTSDLPRTLKPNYKPKLAFNRSLIALLEAAGKGCCRLGWMEQGSHTAPSGSCPHTYIYDASYSAAPAGHGRLMLRHEGGATIHAANAEGPLHIAMGSIIYGAPKPRNTWP